MSSGLGPKISPNEQRSRGRTLYEAPGWGGLSTEEIEAMRGRMDAACPGLAHDVKIRSMESDLVIEIPGIATDEQIARLRQLLLVEAAFREGPAKTPADGSD